MRQALRPALEHIDCRLVELRLDGSNLTLYIDREEGVSVEDCRRASERAGFVLEMDDNLRGDYRFEVSSPGLARPLRFEADFRQYLGREVKLKLRGAGGKKYRGSIESCENAVLTLALDGKKTELRLEDIKRANLVPEG